MVCLMCWPGGSPRLGQASTLVPLEGQLPDAASSDCKTTEQAMKADCKTTEQAMKAHDEAGRKEGRMEGCFARNLADFASALALPRCRPNGCSKPSALPPQGPPQLVNCRVSRSYTWVWLVPSAILADSDNALAQQSLQPRM